MESTFNPKADSDNDGFKDQLEYLAGTDPTNPDSVLKLRDLRREPDSGLTIKWSSTSGKIYSIERTPSLTQGFHPLVTNILATPPVNTYTDTPDACESYFYRIKVE